MTGEGGNVNESGAGVGWGGVAAGEERRVTFVMPVSVVGIVIPSP